MTLTLHNENVLLILQKGPAILQCVVTEIWPGQSANLKSGFLAITLKFLRKFEFEFFVHSFSKYVDCEKSLKFLYVRF